MLKYKQQTTYTSGAFDIKTLVTESVIESHLKVDYSDESVYLDALVAAAWDRVEQHLGIKYAAQTLAWEAYSHQTLFTFPVSSERISNVTLSLWDGAEYLTATDVRTSNLGFPTTVEIDDNDTAYKSCDTEGATIMMKATADIAEVTPEPAIQQAFLLYLGFLYEKREAVITGTTASEMPLAYTYLLQGYRKNNGWFK